MLNSSSYDIILGYIQGQLEKKQPPYEPMKVPGVSPDDITREQRKSETLKKLYM